MGPSSNETLRARFSFFRLSQHPKNLRTLPTLKIFHIYLRCQRRISLLSRNDSKNRASRIRQRRKSVLQKPLVHFRFIHGDEYLGIRGATDSGDSRNRSKIFIAVDFKIATSVNYDSVFESFPEIFHAAKPNKSNFQVRLNAKLVK